jgi:hypothetical protein
MFNKINIYSNWKVGVLGKFIFHKTYRDKIENYNKIKNQLLIQGCQIYELHQVANL